MECELRDAVKMSIGIFVLGPRTLKNITLAHPNALIIDTEMFKYSSPPLSSLFNIFALLWLYESLLCLQWLVHVQSLCPKT